MKRLFLIVCLFILPGIVHAEDIYCGDFNGKPAYVELESIELKAIKTNDYVISEDGVARKYYHVYSANIYADDLWYKVLFNRDRGTSFSVSILDKYKKDTMNYVYTIKFDFAFETVKDNLNEANRRRSEEARKSLESSDRSKIEAAKDADKQKTPPAEAGGIKK